MSKRVLAIDPGPVQSALVEWDGERVVFAEIMPNGKLNEMLLEMSISENYQDVDLVIEQVVSYGMAVGAETFETVFWSGRFCESFGSLSVYRMPRQPVKLHLCHDSRAKDANVSQAIRDRFGAPGTKKNPGILYGIKSHLWSALALAVTFWDCPEKGG